MPGAAGTDRAPRLMIERTSDRWVSIVLSVLLHGTLVAVLVYGFWTYRQSRPPEPTLAIEAAVVDSRSVNPAALNAPPAPQPEPQPPPPEVKPPEPEPDEPTGPPEPTPAELAQREQAQKEQAEKERATQEQAEHEAAEKQRQLDEQKQEEAQRQADEQRKAQEKQEADRKAADAKKRAEEQRLAEQKRAEAAQRDADEKQRAESEAELRNSLAAEEHADQLRSSGALASWSSQITARIQRAWLRPPSARSGIECVLHITQAPGGAVLSAHIESCNGDQAVRESIEAAAYRASPLPPPPDPSLFERDLEVTFKPD
jgi:colicin import membrane protein